MGFLSALLISLSLMVSPPVIAPVKVLPPDVNLSAIRQIVCEDGMMGTGFVINDGIVATARHVTVDEDGVTPTECMDAGTKVHLTTYYRDADHDFALMKPDSFLFVFYPLRYSCAGYQKGPVNLYGYRPESFRQNNLVATNKIVPKFELGGIFPPIYGLRQLAGQGAAGMSGGPGIQEGTVRGIVNVGQWDPKTGIPRAVLSTELKNTVLCSKV